MNENIYWNGKGKYQEWYDELWKQVPAHGKAEKTHIDLVRCVSKLYYDHYNNGGGNWDVLKDIWGNIDYWKYEVAEAHLTNYSGGYRELLKQIKWTMDEIERLDNDEELYPDLRKQKLDSLDDKWELLSDIIIKYAWEKEHGN